MLQSLTPILAVVVPIGVVAYTILVALVIHVFMDQQGEF